MTLMHKMTLALLMTAVGFAASAQMLYEEGKHYQQLEQPQPTSSDGVEVLEFFSYGCSHCYDFEEDLNPWKLELAADVDFQRVPTGLGRAFFQQMSAAFYLAEALGVSEQVHPELFAELHEHHNHELASMPGLQSFFEKHGISAEAFQAAAESETVRTRFSEGEARAPRYGIAGVPTMIVNGKYRVGRNEHVTSYAELLAVVDYLIESERPVSR